MSNPGVIILAAQNGHLPYRFEIEDNIGEAVHIHYKDIRLDLTVKEFKELTDRLPDCIDALVAGTGWSCRDVDPVFLLDVSCLLPELMTVETDWIFLGDMTVDTRDESGMPAILPLPHSRIIKALSGDSTENDTHRQMNYFGIKSSSKLTNQQRIEYNTNLIKERGYPVDGQYIILFDNETLIRDGQHRAGILYALRGNEKVPVQRYRFRNPHQKIYARYNRIDERDWVETICRSAAQPVINGVRFPGFPDPKLSVGMIGSSGEQALREVAPIYLAIHEYARAADIVFGPETRVLDFGCGFGRLLRFFMKDIAPGNLIGTDVDASFIAVCKELFRGGDFDVNAPYPPLHYPDASFDVIYAYSVFSHLSEKAHKLWLKEIRRLIKPNGLIFLTLRQKNFIAQCVKLHTTSDISQYEKKMADAFGDMESVLPRYIKGEFIYVPYGGGGVRTDDFYGDAVIPPKYIEKYWTTAFHIVDIVDDLQRFSQAMVVLQWKQQRLQTVPMKK
jgi:SAM-dependent methyltransferase